MSQIVRAHPTHWEEHLYVSQGGYKGKYFNMKTHLVSGTGYYRVLEILGRLPGFSVPGTGRIQNMNVLHVYTYFKKREVESANASKNKIKNGNGKTPIFLRSYDACRTLAFFCKFRLFFCCIDIHSTLFFTKKQKKLFWDLPLLFYWILFSG